MAVPNTPPIPDSPTAPWDRIQNFLSASAPLAASVAETYWVNTKLHPRVPLMPLAEDPIAQSNSEAELEQQQLLEALVVSGGKRYESFPTVMLPEPDALELPGLRETMQRRRSIREFDPRHPISLSSLAAVLHLSYGWNPARPRDHGGFKYVPSAGGLYPLELYLVAVRIESLRADTLYHYRPTGHLLEELATVRCGELGRLLAATPWIERAGAVIFVTGVLPRLTWKYGERALRYLLLDAGHLAQNACLVAAALGLGICPVVGFYDDRVHDFLDVDGVSELALYLLPLGMPNPERHEGHSS